MTATKKVSDLNGDDLALWVARAAGYEITQLGGNGGFLVCSPDDSDLGGYIGCNLASFAPHQNWAQGGPLFSAARIQTQTYRDGSWHAQVAGGGLGHDGETELIAKARMFICLKYGETVEEVAA